MQWLLLSLVAALAWSFGSFIDNYLTDVVFSKKTPQSMKIANGISYIIVALVLLFVAPPAPIETWQALLLIASGVLASFSSIPYFMGLKNE